MFFGNFLFTTNLLTTLRQPTVLSEASTPYSNNLDFAGHCRQSRVLGRKGDTSAGKPPPTPAFLPVWWGGGGKISQPLRYRHDSRVHASLTVLVGIDQFMMVFFPSVALIVGIRCTAKFVTNLQLDKSFTVQKSNCSRKAMPTSSGALSKWPGSCRQNRFDEK